MNRTNIIVFILSSFLLSCFGQTSYFLGDTTHFKYINVFPANPDIDSVIFIKEYEKRYTDWTIYFEKNKKKLAYKSVVKSDTCSITNYWRNGKIKSIDTYVNKGKYDFRLSCSDSYCQNGQQIVHWCTDANFFVTRYYCSGKKQMEWTSNGIGVEGLIIKWYENGQKLSQGNFANNMQEGEWKYWDDKGKLLKVEIWKEGSLTETK